MDYLDFIVIDFITVSGSPLWFCEIFEAVVNILLSLVTLYWLVRFIKWSYEK